MKTRRPPLAVRSLICRWNSSVSLVYFATDVGIDFLLPPGPLIEGEAPSYATKTLFSGEYVFRHPYNLPAGGNTRSTPGACEDQVQAAAHVSWEERGLSGGPVSAGCSR